MKIARFFAVIFGALGAAVMVFSIGLCLFSLKAPVKLGDIPQEAVSCAQEFSDALNAGDLSLAARKLYGQPDLGVSDQPREEVGGILWNAYLDSISCELLGDFYVKDNGICRDIRISVLDIPSVTGQWNGWVHTLLTAHVQSAQNMEEIYDENNNFRADLVDRVIREAVTQSLTQETGILTEVVTLKFVCQDGQWYVVPEAALLTCLAGGVA